MTRFGDAEPEDAYDATDPVAVLLDNVRRRLILAAADPHGDPARVRLAARHIATLAERVRDDCRP